MNKRQAASKADVEKAQDNAELAQSERLQHTARRCLIATCCNAQHAGNQAVDTAQATGQPPPYYEQDKYAASYVTGSD